MASKTWRREWVRGLPWAFGVGRYERKRLHWASERSVGYGILIGDSLRNHPNLHLYQTGSKDGAAASVAGRAGRSEAGDRLTGRRFPWRPPAAVPRRAPEARVEEPAAHRRA